MELGGNEVSIAHDGRERLYMIRRGDREVRDGQGVSVYEVEITSVTIPLSTG